MALLLPMNFIGWECTFEAAQHSTPTTLGQPSQAPYIYEIQRFLLVSQPPVYPLFLPSVLDNFYFDFPFQANETKPSQAGENYCCIDVNKQNEKKLAFFLKISS